MIIVNKFGGGILDGANPIKQLPKIFEKQAGQYSINVFSAFGKTTNNFEQIIDKYINGEKKESEKLLNELKSFHIKITHKLFPKEHIIFGAIEDIFKKIRHMLSLIGCGKNTKFIYDQIVPYGEILASLIVSEYLSYIGIKNKLVNATDFLKTDSNFTVANVNKKATLENLKLYMGDEIFSLHKNIITQGFIGFSDENMTTLGREGSDYTAGLLGNLMNASKVVLWKDVPGVMDKDPKLVGSENAKKINFLTYDNLDGLLQTAALGLVHPKTINEVREKKIPLQVRSFWDLKSEGTLISVLKQL